MDMFHRAVRHQQAILMRKILHVSGLTVDGLLHGSTIVPMGTLNNDVGGRKEPYRIQRS